MKRRLNKPKQLRSAFTLVEMLIAMALTLILVYAIAEFYAYIGNAVRDGRATIEMGGQLRAATVQLNEDLQSMTLRPTAWIDRDTSPGYATFYEGPYSDAYPDGGTTDIYADSDNDNVPDIIQNSNTTNLIGDGDDVIAFTIRSKDVPFQAQVWDGMNYVAVQSQYAEVMWYTTYIEQSSPNNHRWDINEPRFLCRRQLLILPSLGTLPMPGNDLSQFRQTTEVSFHLDGMGRPVANSLADLSLRQNRFGSGGGYPYHLQLNPTNDDSLLIYSFNGTKFGEDRVLANLLSFDVRVFDPTAPIYEDAGRATPLAPGDLGYRGISTAAIGYGAFVDLNYNRTGMGGSSIFSGGPSSTFNIPMGSSYQFVYWDTWPTYYEIHGPGTGLAYNGLDDNSTNGVDDPGERQTQPPYFVPLRGIQVRIRMYEPQTRQMRQATVGADFIAD